MERAIASRTRPADTVEIRQLRAFLMLAELGRITAAARALGLAQSTVSETLAALERRLGAALRAGHQRCHPHAGSRQRSDRGRHRGADHRGTHATAARAQNSRCG